MSARATTVLLALAVAVGCTSAPGAPMGDGGSPSEVAREGSGSARGLAVESGLDAPTISTETRAQLAAPFTDGELAQILRLSPLPPPPADPTNRVGDDPAAATLGQWLFFDRGLSPDGAFSCATCHEPERAFADGRALAEGRQVLARHTPTLWNVAYQRWFYWDGRRDSLWAQALVPIEDADEMGGNRLAVVHRLRRDPILRPLYEDVFGRLPPIGGTTRVPLDARPPTFAEFDPSHPPDEFHPPLPEHLAWESMAPADRHAVDTVFANVGKAIAAYERRLVSRHAPFDTFVEGLAGGDPGKLAALDASAQRGLALFVGDAGCVRCHSGPALSDREFHNIALPLERDATPDTGRYGGLRQVTGHAFTGTGPHSDAPDSTVARKIDYLVPPAGASGAGPSDRHVLHAGDLHAAGQFKTPGLRNVATSAPYMHAGQLADLHAVLEHYSTLGGAERLPPSVEPFFEPLELSAAERADLIAFLQALTDENVDPALLQDPWLR